MELLDRSCCFVECYDKHRDLHSFPTRRSSDLDGCVMADQEVDVAPGDERSSQGLMADEVPEEAEVLPPDGLVEVQERSEEHTSELQSLRHLVCRLLLEKKKLPRSINPEPASNP